MTKSFNNEETSEVKDRILGVARDLFTHKGYKGTSVREIAAKSDTNVAMVNYYFNSKYNLFEIVFEESLEVLWHKVYSTITSDKDFFELIDEWVDSYYEVLLKYPQLPIFLLNEVTLDPQRLTNRLQSREPYKVFLRISERIRQEVAKGTIRETPPLDFLLNVISMSIFPFIFRNLARPLAGVSEDTYEAMLREHKKYVVQFIVNALEP